MREAKSKAKRVKKSRGIAQKRTKTHVFDSYPGRWAEEDAYENDFAARHGGRVLTDTLRDEP